MRIPTGRRVVKLDEPPIRGPYWALLVILDDRPRRVDPEQILCNRTLGRPVVIPAGLQAQSTRRHSARLVDPHVTEHRRDGLGGPRRQTSCRFSFQADDPRWSDDKCREINIHQSSLSKH